MQLDLSKLSAQSVTCRLQLGSFSHASGSARLSVIEFVPQHLLRGLRSLVARYDVVTTVQDCESAGKLGPETLCRALPEPSSDGLDRQFHRRALNFLSAYNRGLDFDRSIGGIRRQHVLGHISAIQIMSGLVCHDHILLFGFSLLLSQVWHVHVQFFRRYFCGPHFASLIRKARFCDRLFLFSRASAQLEARCDVVLDLGHPWCEWCPVQTVLLQHILRRRS